MFCNPLLKQHFLWSCFFLSDLINDVTGCIVFPLANHIWHPNQLWMAEVIFLGAFYLLAPSIVVLATVEFFLPELGVNDFVCQSIFADKQAKPEVEKSLICELSCSPTLTMYRICLKVDFCHLTICRRLHFFIHIWFNIALIPRYYNIWHN